MNKQQLSALLAKITNGEELTLEEKVDILGEGLEKAIENLRELDLATKVSNCMIVDLAMRAGITREEFGIMVGDNVRLVMKHDASPEEIVKKAVSKARSNSNVH